LVGLDGFIENLKIKKGEKGILIPLSVFPVANKTA
jgi:hypothetical protein